EALTTLGCCLVYERTFLVEPLLLRLKHLALRSEDLLLDRLLVRTPILLQRRRHSRLRSRWHAGLLLLRRVLPVDQTFTALPFLGRRSRPSLARARIRCRRGIGSSKRDDLRVSTSAASRHAIIPKIGHRERSRASTRE